METLIASAIFIIGFTGITGLIVNAATRRSVASVRAVTGRLAFDEYTRYMQRGHRAMPPPGTYTRTAVDPLGREVVFTTTVFSDCNAITDTSFVSDPLPTGAQQCCPGGVCCIGVRIVARSTAQGAGRVTIEDTYTGFVTRSC